MEIPDGWLRRILGNALVLAAPFLVFRAWAFIVLGLFGLQSDEGPRTAVAGALVFWGAVSYFILGTFGGTEQVGETVRFKTAMPATITAVTPKWLWRAFGILLWIISVPCLIFGGDASS